MEPNSDSTRTNQDAQEQPVAQTTINPTATINPSVSQQSTLTQSTNLEQMQNTQTGPQNQIINSPVSGFNPASPTKPKNTKKLFILGIAFMTVIILSTGFILLKGKNNNTQNLKQDFVAINIPTGIKYSELSSSNKSTDLTSYFATLNSTNVFQIYNRVISSKQPESPLPSNCSITENDLLNYDGGIVVSKNLLKNNGLSYASLNDIYDAYASVDANTKLATIEGKQVVSLTDGGDGFYLSCESKSNEYKKTLDYTTTYIYLTESGDDIVVSLVKPDNLKNGISMDSASATKAYNQFSEIDINKEIEYIVKNN